MLIPPFWVQVNASLSRTPARPADAKPQANAARIRLIPQVRQSPQDLGVAGPGVAAQATVCHTERVQPVHQAQVVAVPDLEFFTVVGRCDGDDAVVLAFVPLD